VKEENGEWRVGNGEWGMESGEWGMMKAQGCRTERKGLAWPRYLLLALALLVSGTLALTPPHVLLDKADLVGSAVCHRLPEHSFFLAGRQLPLCARCTGTYLGFLAGFLTLALAKRRGEAGLPPLRVLAVLALFIGVWAVDGLNSLLDLLFSLHLYRPVQGLRLFSGTLEGLALSALVLPMLRLNLWHETSSEPVIGGLRELALWMLPALLLALLVQARVDWLLYPIALLSAGSVVFVFLLFNLLALLLLTHREARARGWHDLFPLLLASLALAVAEILIINALRPLLMAWKWL